MTQSQVVTRVLLVLAVMASNELLAADYPVDTRHPRLLLPERHLRLVRREAERQSLRWNQFHALMDGGAEMAEPGFANSLYYIVTGDQQFGKRAIDWALGPGNDLRQLAIVFDWCEPVMLRTQADTLSAKLRKLMAASPQPNEDAAATIARQRDRAFAAIALAGFDDFDPSPVLSDVIDGWWEKSMVPAIKEGKLILPVASHFAAYELFHAVRDNLDTDIRESVPKYFATLPIYHLLAHYPEPWNAPDGEYRVPVSSRPEAPNLREATLSRAAALSMVALDVNSQETGFLQGWLIQDAYLMNSPLGSPYEFLWANPYQPGLSYHYLPNIFHDESNGRLILRSTWEDDATWFYQAQSVRQLAREGEVVDMAKQPLTGPIAFGAATTMLPAAAGRVDVKATEAHAYYLFGLKPSTNYELEVDDEEMREFTTDAGGVAELRYPVAREASAILRPSAAR